MNRMLEAKAGIPVRASGWTFAAGAFAVAVITLVACYWQTARSLVWVWGHDGTYQYAFLIFPLSLWVAFDLRHQVRAKAPAPSAWGILAVAALVCVWYAGHIFTVNLPQHFALVALFPALVLACWGWRALWILKFPLSYLVVFAVPWGDGLVGPLQDITAHFAVGALNVTGTPVLINGREIITPSAVWMVADACSGVRFFIACTALGCLYAYLMYHRWWKRVAFVVLAAVVPVIANGFRVYFTILIGETWGLKYATGTDHMVFGWQFFGTVLVLLLLAGWFFRDRLVIRDRPVVIDGGVTGARAVVWPVALALLIAGPIAAARFAIAAPPDTVHVTAPALAGWIGPQAAAGAWQPGFVGAAGQFRAAYQSAAGGDAVELFHAVYTGSPRRGHNLITYGNDVYDPANARILASRTMQVELANGLTIAARELRLAGRAGSRLVWYWYCVDGRCTASPVLTKLLQAWAVLRGRAPRSSVWAMSMPVAGGDIAQARKQLLALARTLTVTGGSGVQFNRDDAARGNVP
ncbi:MAG TPA: exosortase A [Rhodanobacteraceae bacterium]|nr:exosortase A [Rhodanobacteraceae bacterium]